MTYTKESKGPKTFVVHNRTRKRRNTVLKRVLFYLILALLFFSCGSKPFEDSHDMSAYYMFRSSEGYHLSDSAREPIKINPVTGEVSFVCIDPLCIHDSPDCPLYEIQSAVISGIRLFFVSEEMSSSRKGDRKGYCEIREYDMVNGEINKLASYSNGIVLLGAYRNSVYYTALIYEKEINGFRFGLFRSGDKGTVELRFCTIISPWKEGWTQGTFHQYIRLMKIRFSGMRRGRWDMSFMLLILTEIFSKPCQPYLPIS